MLSQIQLRGAPSAGAHRAGAIMVTMTTTCTRTQAGLEYKSAPAMLAPRPSRPVSSRATLSGVTEVDGAGELVALAAVISSSPQK